MTPDDLAADRTMYEQGYPVPNWGRYLALADALTEAWERAELAERYPASAWSAELEAMRERAERAEADLAIADGIQHAMKVALDRAEADRDNWRQECQHMETVLAEHRRMEAALARIQSLCDEGNPADWWQVCEFIVKVRAALENTDG